MSDNPKVRNLDARLTVNWAADIAIEPGSTGDRTVPGTGKAKTRYRPDTVHLEYQVTAISSGSMAPCSLSAPTAGPLAAAMRLTALTIRGPKVKPDGTLTETRHNEEFWGRPENAPPWAQVIAAAAAVAFGAPRETAQQDEQS